jgi:hypothetical protein
MKLEIYYTYINKHKDFFPLQIKFGIVLDTFMLV